METQDSERSQETQDFDVLVNQILLYCLWVILYLSSLSTHLIVVTKGKIEKFMCFMREERQGVGKQRSHTNLQSVFVTGGFLSQTCTLRLVSFKIDFPRLRIRLILRKCVQGGSSHMQNLHIMGQARFNLIAFATSAMHACAFPLDSISMIRQICKKLSLMASPQTRCHSRPKPIYFLLGSFPY